MSIGVTVISGNTSANDVGARPTRQRAAPSSRRRHLRRALVPLAAVGVAAVALLPGTTPVGAAIVPTINLATAANYSVLGGQEVTNTGPSTLGLSVGVYPGTSVTGFPPGGTSGVINAGDPVALQAQTDLTTAYVDAAGRPLNLETTSELGGLTLVGGVFAASVKGPLTITGPLVLDGQGDPNSVFIFQTDSTLITASGSSVSLINGAQECNVFWQVGSSATLGTGSTFVGNILALTAVTVTTGVTVHGRALARNAEVTLDNDVFTSPTCDLSAGGGTTGGTTTGGTATTGTGTGGAGAAGTGTGATPNPSLNTTLPETGSDINTVVGSLLAGAVVAIGLAALYISRRRPSTNG